MARHNAPKEAAVAAAWGRPVRDLLIELYVGQRLSMAECAAILGVSPRWVYRHLKRYDIPRRQRRFVYDTDLRYSGPTRPRPTEGRDGP